MKDKFRFYVMIAARTAVAMLLFVSAPAARSGPAQSQNGSNLATNGGFEINAGGLLADGWVAWSKDTAPEYYASSIAHSGALSQQVKSKKDHTHHGGFYQRVSAGIAVGNAVSFSIWHNWPDDPKDGSQSVQVRLGIDPHGETDPHASGVVWTADEQYATDRYQQLLLATTAMSTTVTVFTRSQSQYSIAAYVLWDDAAVTSGPWQHTCLPLIARDYVPPCSLLNGGFEGDYVDWGSSTLAAPDWSPWWNDGYAKPEFNPTTCYAPGYPDCSRIRSGEGSQQYGINWKHYQGGLYQQVTGCTVGDTLRFSAYSLGYAARAVGSTTSDPDGKFKMKVGIDPYGGTDPGADSVIAWSPEAFSLDIFGRFEVTATVASSTVTVFLYSESLHEPIQEWYHNTSYWDDASLERLP